MHQYCFYCGHKFGKPYYLFDKVHQTLMDKFFLNLVCRRLKQSSIQINEK